MVLMSSIRHEYKIIVLWSIRFLEKNKILSRIIFVFHEKNNTATPIANICKKKTNKYLNTIS